MNSKGVDVGPPTDCNFFESTKNKQYAWSQNIPFLPKSLVSTNYSF